MKKIKITYLLGLLFLPILLYGQDCDFIYYGQDIPIYEQNPEFIRNKYFKENDSLVDLIDKRVDLINSSEKNYTESIIEGPIISKNIFIKNGGWETYYLFNEKNDKLPMRIKYNERFNKKYQNLEFFYQNGELIFAKLNVGFYRGKGKNFPFEKEFYFKDSKSILTKYNNSDFYLSKEEKKRIFDSNYNDEIFGIEYIKQMDKKVRIIINKDNR